MIKLNAGFSRKVGEPNYGSRGASVNVDLELESNLISQPDMLHEKIRALFALAKRAVDEELNGNGQPASNVERRSAARNSGNGNAGRTTNTEPEPETNKANAASATCAHCGSERMSKKVVEYSTERFGKPTCYRCQQKMAGGNGAGNGNSNNGGRY